MDEAVGRVTIVAKRIDNLSCRAEWKTSVDVAIGDTVEVRGLRSVVRSRDDYGTSGIWFDLPVNARVKRGDEVRVYPAGTALEARKPQVPAEVIELVREGINEVFAAMDEVPLSGRVGDQRQEVDRNALAGLRLAVQAHTTCVKDLLAAVEAVPDAPDEERLTEEWHCPEGPSTARCAVREGQFTKAVTASLCVDCWRRCAPSTPDFAAMDPDDLSLEEVQALRDWLDERGRRKVAGLVNEGGAWWICALWARDTSGLKIVCAEGPSEPAALLALCQKVAAEEAS